MTKWLRKTRVAERYDCHPRSVDRAAAEGRLPKPKYPFGNSIPAWDEAELDEHDRAAIVASVAAGEKVKAHPSPEAIAKAALQKKKIREGGSANAS
jgi:hypothetical protein